MKRSTKLWLAIGAVLLGVGVMLAILVLALGGGEAVRGGAEMKTTAFDISERFASVSVNAETEDIRFVRAEDGKCRVVFVEPESVEPSAAVKNGTLTIGMKQVGKWPSVTIFSVEPSITVYLPAGEYEALLIRESTGAITVPQDFRFASMDLSLSTGSVDCRADVRALLQIEASTGSLYLSELEAGELRLKVTTGRVELRGVSCAGDVRVDVSTGAALFADLSCQSLSSTGSTGGVTLKNVLASGDIRVERSTGDIRFEHSDAAELEIKTSTGEVSGTLRSDKVFIVKSDTGDIDVPETVSGGKCKITTDTGDIRIAIG